MHYTYHRIRCTELPGGGGLQELKPGSKWLAEDRGQAEELKNRYGYKVSRVNHCFPVGSYIPLVAAPHFYFSSPENLHWI